MHNLIVMEPEDIRKVFLSFPKVTEETPFDETTVVYKTAGKMFALTSWDPNPLRFNLKCDPERALKLRDQHACVLPGYHMSKKHWNTVIYDGSVEDDMFLEWVKHSFEMVAKSLPKKVQVELLEAFQSDTDKHMESSDKQELRSQMRKGI